MKKVTLTQEEEDQLEKLKFLSIEKAKIDTVINKKASDFWYSFQKRMGYGNFALDLMNEVVYEKESRDIMKNSRSQN